MKHRLSVIVRVDGAVEHDFSRVLSDEEKTRDCLDEVAQAISGVSSEWERKQRLAMSTWPGMARCFTRQG